MNLQKITRRYRLQCYALRGFGLAGMLLFLPLFIFTFADPHVIERTGSAFIAQQIESDVHHRIDSIPVTPNNRLETLLGEKARALKANADQQMIRYKALLKAEAPRIVAEQIATMRNLDCTCRQQWEDALTRTIVAGITSAETVKANLADYTRAKYMAMVEALTRDVRVFLGINTSVFLLLLVVSWCKPQAVSQLFLPGALLLVSTLLCTCFYLFEQNWLYAMLYSDYTGFAYLLYLVAVFALLCDIVFNRARISSKVLNNVLSAFGNVVSVGPC